MRPTRLVLALPCLAALVLASGACSDPVPLIPQGAWAITFQDPGGTCNVTGHNANVGTVGSEGDIEYKTDGTDGAEIECTVEPSGGSFNFSGRVSFKGQYLSISASGLKAGATVDDPSSATLEFQTVQSSDIYRGSSCEIYFNENGQAVEEGKIWATFRCTEIVGNQGDTCSLQTSFVAFDNCVGAATEDGEEEE